MMRAAKPKGLKNLGNTCFLNAIVQAISSCPPMTAFLNKSKFTSEFAAKLSSCIEDIRCAQQGSSHTAYNAEGILQYLTEYNPEFEGYNQQDAEELYQAVVCILSEEARPNTSLRSNAPSRHAPYLVNMGANTSTKPGPKSSQKDTTNFVTLNDIKPPYEGFLGSVITCDICGFPRPIKLENFVDIPLTIPTDNPALSSLFAQSSSHRQSQTRTRNFSNIRGGRGAINNFQSQCQFNGSCVKSSLSTSSVSHTAASSGELTLEQCLRAYLQEEKIEGLECPSCTAKSTFVAATAKLSKLSYSAYLNEDLKLLTATVQRSCVKGKNDVLNCFPSVLEEGIYIEEIELHPGQIALPLVAAPLSTNLSESCQYSTSAIVHSLVAAPTSTNSIVSCHKSSGAINDALTTASSSSSSSTTTTTNSIEICHETNGEINHSLTAASTLTNSIECCHDVSGPCNHSIIHAPPLVETIGKCHDSECAGNCSLIACHGDSGVTSQSFDSPDECGGNSTPRKSKEKNEPSERSLLKTSLQHDQISVRSKNSSCSVRSIYASYVNFGYLINQVRSTARRQLYFARLPSVLCFHINRRVYCPLTDRMKKLGQVVKFPLELDMQSYAVPVPVIGANRLLGSSELEARPDAGVISAVRDMYRAWAHAYELCAVVQHEGTERSGHYTTYGRLTDGGNNSSWAHFSDECVRRVNQEEVLSSQAYMLFYVRRASLVNLAHT